MTLFLYGRVFYHLIRVKLETNITQDYSNFSCRFWRSFMVATSWEKGGPVFLEGIENLVARGNAWVTDKWLVQEHKIFTWIMVGTLTTTSRVQVANHNLFLLWCMSISNCFFTGGSATCINSGGDLYKKDGVVIRNFERKSKEVIRSCFVGMASNVVHL